MTLYLFFPFLTGFQLSLRTVGKVNPAIGATLRLICEIQGVAPDIQPQWKAPNNAEVASLSNGKYILGLKKCDWRNATYPNFVGKYLGS